MHQIRNLLKDLTDQLIFTCLIFIKLQNRLQETLCKYNLYFLKNNYQSEDSSSDNCLLTDYNYWLERTLYCLIKKTI